MLSPQAKSGNKSSNKLPFTADSIKHYELFQTLEPKVKAKMCELLTSGMVSPKGNIKRPPNSFMLFRRHRFSTLSKKYGSEPNGSLKPIPSMVKDDWRASEVGKVEYSKLAQHAQQEHNARFPAYKYTPIPERKWKAISEDGKKKWFFEFLSLVSNNLVQGQPGAKPSGLDIDEWIQDPDNHKYVSDKVLDEILRNAEPTTGVIRGSRGRFTIQTTRNRSSENVTQTHNSIDRNVPTHHANATLRPFPGTSAHLQPLPLVQSSSRCSATTGTTTGSRLFYSITPATKEGHEISQGDPLHSQTMPDICYGSNIDRNQVGPINMAGEPKGLTSLALPLADDRFAPDVEVLWDMNDVEGHNLYLARGSYDANWTRAYDQPVVAGSGTIINFAPMSQPSDQGGALNSGFTDLNEEPLCDYSELMNEFLHPFVLEDIGEPSGSAEISLYDAF
ncbi:unnamed protein product [Rhizoctonia solani]|uniref:HMG box domain-containing protein n=1 Tax=Rhizoctonia solani TaxID=456999 RepID=A0A8H3C2D4_9AGAM|nr:unnamed protein product [Rhizoctonia solani]